MLTAGAFYLIAAAAIKWFALNVSCSVGLSAAIGVVGRSGWGCAASPNTASDGVACSERRVLPDLIAVFALALDDDLDFLQRVEDLAAEPFVPELKFST